MAELTVRTSPARSPRSHGGVRNAIPRTGRSPFVPAQRRVGPGKWAGQGAVPVLEAMQRDLDRSSGVLSDQPTPACFLGYEITEERGSLLKGSIAAVAGRAGGRRVTGGPGFGDRGPEQFQERLVLLAPPHRRCRCCKRGARGMSDDPPRHVRPIDSHLAGPGPAAGADKHLREGNAGRDGVHEGMSATRRNGDTLFRRRQRPRDSRGSDRGHAGGVVGRRERSSLLLSVEVRVGDRSLDNTNFFTRPEFAPMLALASYPTLLPLGDDYAELRGRIWLATDSAYNQGLDHLSQRGAVLQTATRVEEVPDSSIEEP